MANKNIANLIFNTQAGNKNSITPEALLEALKEAKLETRLFKTKKESELEKVIRETEGIIISAGGDGTFKCISQRILKYEKKNPLVILPMGTANNIAKAVGINQKPMQILKALDSAVKYEFDVAKVVAPWGNTYMFEGIGFGFFAQIMHEYNPNKGKSVKRALQTIINKLPFQNDSKHIDLNIDGKKIRKKFGLVQILNTNAVGPRLKFSPNASPRDGLLDVVYIEEQKREYLLVYLSKLVTNKINTSESITLERGKKVSFEWDGFPIHIDDKTFSHKNKKVSEGTVEVSIVPKALELWIPK